MEYISTEILKLQEYIIKDEEKQFNVNSSFGYIQYPSISHRGLHLLLFDEGLVRLCCKNKHCGQDRDRLFKDRCDMQDRKWFLLTYCLFSLRIFQETKIQKCCFSNKTTCLSEHSFETRVHSH